MQQVFIENTPINGEITVTGQDAHHLIRVVRLKNGEKIRVSCADGSNYICKVEGPQGDDLVVSVLEEVPSTELPNKIYLFQALPKGDRIETIIEKCVELGVYEIVPVQMKNCIVKLDDKKKKTKLARYQAIAESAAKQSKRSIIPQIHEIIDYKQAFDYAKDLDVILLPYECKNGMKDTHDYPGHFTDMEFMPEALRGKVFYEPAENKHENVLKAYLETCWPKYYPKK